MLCISGIVMFLFANMPYLSMVGRNNIPGRLKSRQKVDSSFGVSLVLLFARLFVIILRST